MIDILCLRGLGLDLYEGLQYLGTYQSYDDCIFDMMFHWSIVDFDTMIKGKHHVNNTFYTVDN